MAPLFSQNHPTRGFRCVWFFFAPVPVPPRYRVPPPLGMSIRRRREEFNNITNPSIKLRNNYNARRTIDYVMIYDCSRGLMNIPRLCFLHVCVNNKTYTIVHQCSGVCVCARVPAGRKYPMPPPRDCCTVTRAHKSPAAPNKHNSFDFRSASNERISRQVRTSGRKISL